MQSSTTQFTVEVQKFLRRRTSMELPSPLSPLSPTFRTMNILTPEAARNKKLAKLNRTFGSNVPIALVFPAEQNENINVQQVRVVAHKSSLSAVPDGEPAGGSLRRATSQKNLHAIRAATVPSLPTKLLVRSASGKLASAYQKIKSTAASGGANENDQEPVFDYISTFAKPSGHGITTASVAKQEMLNISHTARPRTRSESLKQSLDSDSSFILLSHSEAAVSESESESSVLPSHSINPEESESEEQKVATGVIATHLHRHAQTRLLTDAATRTRIMASFTIESLIENERKIHEKFARGCFQRRGSDSAILPMESESYSLQKSPPSPVIRSEEEPVSAGMWDFPGGTWEGQWNANDFTMVAKALREL